MASSPWSMAALSAAAAATSTPSYASAAASSASAATGAAAAREALHEDGEGDANTEHASTATSAAANAADENADEARKEEEDNDDEDEDDDEDDEDREVLVELDNVHKTYLLGVEGVPALRGVSVKIYKGEWIVVYGTSGGGKTTLLNIIGTIDKPTKGELVIGDYRVNPSTKDNVLASIRLNTLGFVFQAFNLLPSMTAQENVELPITLKGDKTVAERKATARALLEQVGLGHRLGHMPNMLSGGEQQRVTIARALANTPPLLLLDEPTGDLDTKNTRNVVRMLRHLNEDLGVTLIMVTHDMYLKNYASRVLYMRDGKLLRTERIRRTRRAEAFRELDAEDTPAVTAAATMEAAVPSSGNNFTHTEVRSINDYPMFSIEVPKPAVRKGKGRA